MMDPRVRKDDIYTQHLSHEMHRDTQGKLWDGIKRSCEVVFSVLLTLINCCCLLQYSLFCLFYNSLTRLLAYLFSYVAYSTNFLNAVYLLFISSTYSLSFKASFTITKHSPSLPVCTPPISIYAPVIAFPSFLSP